jgi:hypothetical protein
MIDKVTLKRPREAPRDLANAMDNSSTYVTFASSHFILNDPVSITEDIVAVSDSIYNLFTAPASSSS